MTSRPESQKLTEAAVRPHMIRGSIWMVVMRWSIRAIGLVSTIILARLLTPEDFGLVAMSMLFVGLIEMMGETGQQAALIRHPNPTREHFDSAWTTQVLVGLVLGTIVILAAPLAGMYFGDPRAVLLVQIFSLRVYLIGFENIGTVLFRKELDFAKEFRFGVYKKLLSFVTTLALAFYLRSYWALVGGIVFGQVFSVVLSYMLHPYRPRICFTKIREIWHFSFWSWVMTMGGYLHNRLDQYTVGAIATSGLMGFYQIAVELAKLPSDELVRPLQRALFPAYSKLSHDPKQLLNAYFNVLSVIVIVAASTSAGIALVAEDLVYVLLGSQWADAAPFIFWLSLAAGVSAYSHSVFLILGTLGHIRYAALQAWWRLIIMIPALAAAAYYAGPEGVAATYLAGVVLLMPTYFILLKSVLPFSVRRLFSFTWRPVIAALAMAVVIQQLPVDLSGLTPALRLAIEVPLGAATFVASLVLLWAASGRPPGAERAGLQYLGTRLAALRPRKRSAPSL
jgi:lipopolysaccharide exporter